MSIITVIEDVLKNHINVIKDLAGSVAPLTCSGCGEPATCVGAYESEEDLGFACDTCCGHGNENGWCVDLERINGRRAP